MSDEKVDIPDVFGDALINVMNEAHAKGRLVTGYVVLLETYDSKGKKKLNTIGSPGMLEYQMYGMIDFASRTFEYATGPDDDDFDDDTDYDPNWHTNDY
jgi:hypothetical protein